MHALKITIFNIVKTSEMKTYICLHVSKLNKSFPVHVANASSVRIW